MRLAAASVALTFGLAFVLGLAQSTHAQTFTVLHTFTGLPDGGYPDAGLIRDAAGNLYGTTYNGGSGCGGIGCGTVFKIDRSGKETVLHTFTGSPDGKNPYRGLVR